MPASRSLAHLMDLLQRAYGAQRSHAPGHPQAVRSMEALADQVRDMLEEGPFRILVAGDGFTSPDLPPEEVPSEARTLARGMEARGMGGLEFRPGAGLNELDLLLFILQLLPPRLEDMGGAASMLPDDGTLRILPVGTAVPGRQEPEPLILPDGPLDLDDDDEPARSMAEATPPGDAGLPAVPAPAPPRMEPLPEPMAPESPGQVPPFLEADLRALFLEAIANGSPVQKPGLRVPWGVDQRDILIRVGFTIPDCGSLAGTGARLGLDRIPPAPLRDSLRKALAGLDPLDQGNVLLGLAGFPQDEYALGQALDFLGPELLAQAVAYAHLQYHPSMTDLALLTVALLQCVHDRDLAMEAIRGRLQFEGWGNQEVEELKEGIQWECQGTDTKLNLSLEQHLIHQQDPHLVMTLGRQLIRAKRTDDLRALAAQLEEELASHSESRRGHGARILADLAVGLRDYGLAKDLERRILAATHDRLCSDNDPTVCQWSAQAVEAMLGRWLLARDFTEVHAELLALEGFLHGPGPSLPWKFQLVEDLLTRVASPANLALLLPALAKPEDWRTVPQAHAILKLMGPPAASCLAAQLEQEEDPAARDGLAAALQAMGARAVPVLKACLAASNPVLVAQALSLLGKAGVDSVLPDIVPAIAHPDLRVRRAAVGALSDLADRRTAAQAVAEVLGAAEEELQLEYLAILGELGEPVAAPAVIQLLQAGSNQGKDPQRIRLRAVETLGLIPCAEAVRPLQELFEKKGLFKGRESIGIRLSAARALAAFNTREARESMALALESEAQEEVRAVLRQYLVRS